MATETKTLASITVQTDGTVIVQETVTVENGSMITTAAIYVYAPGDDISADNYDRVKAVCAAVWTDAVVTAYKAAHPRSSTATSAA